MCAIVHIIMEIFAFVTAIHKTVQKFPGFSDTHWVQLQAL